MNFVLIALALVMIAAAVHRYATAQAAITKAQKQAEQERRLRQAMAADVAEIAAYMQSQGRALEYNLNIPSEYIAIYRNVEKGLSKVARLQQTATDSMGRADV